MDELKRARKNARSWVQRREETFKPCNSDDLWSYIKTKYPTLSPEDQEQAYQFAAQELPPNRRIRT